MPITPIVLNFYFESVDLGADPVLCLNITAALVLDDVLMADSSQLVVELL